MLISTKVPFYSPLNSSTLGFLGCGSIAQNFIRGYLKHSFQLSKKIFISGRNIKRIQRLAQKYQVQFVLDNEELLEKAEVIFICVKPTEAEELLQSSKSFFRPEHTVLSLIAGIPFHKLITWGLSCNRLIRLMPNISVSVGKACLPFCSLNNQKALNSFVEELLKPLGKTLNLKKEMLLAPSTVGSSSGLAFVLELMEYWLEWTEGEGLPYHLARDMVVQTFLGAAELSKQRENKSFSDLQKEILSPKGVTQQGLKTMREIELERVLRLCFEKAHSKVKDIEDSFKS